MEALAIAGHLSQGIMRVKPGSVQRGGMRIRHRAVAVVLAVALLAGLRISQQLYRWYAYGPEREAIARLETRLESTAFRVVNTHVEADSLLGVLEVLDRDLLTAREELYGADRAGQQTSGGLSGYNRRVAERNRLLRRWRQVLLSNHATTDQYNLLVDSIRLMAEKMGESFYPIRSPAEIVFSRNAGAAARDTVAAPIEASPN